MLSYSTGSQSAPAEASAAYRPSWGLLAMLMTVALLPRAAGALWGGIHPDENINASVKLLAGQWIPDSHYYPPLSNTLNAAAFAVMYAMGRLIGVWHSAADFRAQYFADPTAFHLVGRLVCATIGAAAAPLTAMLASRIGARRWGCILAALLVAILPVNVLLSHISKSADIGMATSFILVALCFVDFTHAPNLWRRAAALGAAMALAVSFKHSAVFFVAPLLLAALALTWARHTPALVRAGLIICATGGLLWTVLNVPILADFGDFLKFQQVQARMSWRPGAAIEIARTVSTYVIDIFSGATAVGVIGFLAVPLILRQTVLQMLWLCTVVAILAVIRLTGLRPTMGLYLPYATLMIALVGVALAHGMANRRALPRVASLAGWAACAALLGLGCFNIVREAMAEPAIAQVARVVRREISPNARIMATRPEQAGVPIRPDALASERARHERLAAKYKVTLPQSARSRSGVAGHDGGYHVRRIPWVIGGLEVYDEEKLDVVAPFAWPLQQEEYELEYWTRQGFTVFVLTDEQQRLTSRIEPYVKLYQQIREQCELVAEIKARKPLLWEGNTRIYRLKELSRAAMVSTDRE